MVKYFGTPALLSDNAPLLPEKCCNYKCFVFTCLFLLFALEKHKKKSQIWYHSTQNSKNGLDKIIGTLNLIFVNTPFGKNNWDESLPVTISYTPLQEFWTTLLLPTAPGVSDLKGAFSQLLFWDLSTGVLWDLDLVTLLATSEHFCVLFEVSFGSLSCWKTHDLWRRPSFLTLGPTLRSKILW